MYSVILVAAMPLFAEQSPPPVAPAGCIGQAASAGCVGSMTVNVQAAGCLGSVARRAPLRTVIANHRNRVESRQAARANRVRVNVYRPAVVAVAPVQIAVAPVRMAARIATAPVRVLCPNGVCPTR